MVIRINPEHLAGICEAAKLWFEEKNRTYHTFTVEERRAKKLRDELWKVDWDEDAELIIMETPECLIF